MQWPQPPSCSTVVHSLCAWGAFECSARMYALRLVKSCRSSGYRDQSCSSSLTHVTQRHVQADYSDKRILGGVGKIEMSVLFIIIKICTFLCSPLLSPHAHIPPPQSWWIQLLKSAISSIIFNYPAIAASIIPLGSILNRKRLLIDSERPIRGRGKTLTSVVITADLCHHTDVLNIIPQTSKLCVDVGSVSPWSYLFLSQRNTSFKMESSPGYYHSQNDKPIYTFRFQNIPTA